MTSEETKTTEITETRPFFVEVTFDKIAADSPRYTHFMTPWTATLMARRGEGNDPVRVAHGRGSTDANAVITLSRTLEDNDWLWDYYPWDTIKLTIINALEELWPEYEKNRQAAQEAEGAGVR